jgi:hypothetical protein
MKACAPPWCQATSASTSAKSGSPVSFPSETPCAGWSYAITWYPALRSGKTNARICAA